MKLVPLIAALAFSMATPAMAQPLQCVPYARANSDINLYGNAHTWWSQAAGVYERGQTPRAGAVLVFKPSSAMRVGHVAVVSQVVDSRRVVLNHANWSRPGMIEKSAVAEDISEKGDWSNVRVWYSPTRSMGLRASPAFGFIYANGSTNTAPAQPAPTSRRFEAAFADLSAAAKNL